MTTTDHTRKSKNALVRRLQRHHSLTTLFRAVDPGPSAQRPDPVQTSRFARKGVVQASLIPAETSLPMGYVVGAQPAAMKIVPVAAVDAQVNSVSPIVARQMETEETSPPSEAAFRPSVETAPQAQTADPEWNRLQRIFRLHQSQAIDEQTISEPTVTPPQPPQAARPTTDNADPEWGRLHRIHHLHKDRRDGGTGPSGTQLPPTKPLSPTKPASPADIQRQPTPPASVSGAGGQVADAATGPVPSARPRPGLPEAAPLAKGTSPNVTQGPQSKGDQISEPPSANRELEVDPRALPQPVPSKSGPGVQVPVGDTPFIQRTTEDATADQSPVTSDDQLENAEQPGSEPRLAVDDPPGRSTPRRPSDVEEPPEHRSTSVETTAGLVFDRSVATSQDDPTGLPAQPLPLQAVWPVQRQVRSIDEGSQAPPAPEPTVNAKAPSPAADIPSAVQRVLQQVSAEQPTDSSVELVMPRRPHPNRPIVAREAAPTMGLEPEAPPPATKHEGVHEPAAAKHERSIQLTADETASPRLIETEIGALPSDLWHLLGQSPLGDLSPEAAITESEVSAISGEKTSTPSPPNLIANNLRASSVSRMEAEGDLTQAIDVKPENAPAHNTTSAPRQLFDQAAESGARIGTNSKKPDPKPVFLQRAPVGPASPDATSPFEMIPDIPGTETEVDLSEPAADKPDIDLDEVARQVYQVLRHRLRVEQERSRGSLLR